MKARATKAVLTLAILILTSLAPALTLAQLQPGETPEIGFIVGGIEAQRGAWPFMAAIVDRGSSPANGQYCGGSLIAAKWVVSAAHCFVNNQGGVSAPSTVQVGLNLLDKSRDRGEILNVVRIIVHPNYNAQTSDNDIALLELVSESTTSTPVALVSSSLELTGLTSTAIGWGLTIPGNNNSAPQVLRQVDVPVVSNQVCNRSYGGITQNMVCAGFAGGGKDSCQGDSGGPLVIKENGVTKLIGITSFGQGCAEANFYGVYARVASLRGFIEQYLPLPNPQPPTPQPPAPQPPVTPPTPIQPTDGEYGLWNGFLQMVNVVELINRSNQDVRAQVNLFAQNGTLASTTFISVPAGAQQDLILNSVPGFLANSYGLIQVSSNIDGRVMFYRATSANFDNFEYAHGVSLAAPISGASYVAFNTFQPSANPVDARDLVANFLAIENLTATSQSFTINKFSASGELLSTQTVAISAKSRLDLEAGHINPGPANVGLIEVTPVNSSALYLAQVFRYGYKADGSFAFAFPLIAQQGSAEPLAALLGSRLGAQNWLEVLNVSSRENAVRVSFYHSSGSLMGVREFVLAAYSQLHLNVNSILGELQTGYARIESLSGAELIAESMFYYRNGSTGSIEAMYGSQAINAVSGLIDNSFNLFLGMENYLKITNPSSRSLNITVTVASKFSSGSSRVVSLAANQSTELDLHRFSTFGTTANSYGVVTVSSPDSSTGLVVETLRIKRSSNGELQFAAPTY